MGLKETENTTEVVLERMENTMMNLEQMSFDSINITAVSYTHLAWKSTASKAYNI